MAKNLKTASKAFVGILIGIIFSIYLAQNNYEFKNYLERKLSSIAAGLFNYQIKTSLKNFNFFFPFINFNEFEVSKPSSNKWHWNAKDYSISFSWLELILNQKLQPTLNFETLSVFSLIENGYPAIIDHLKELIFERKLKIPITIKNLKIKNGLFNFVDNQSGLEAFIQLAVDLIEQPKNIRSNIYFKDGGLSISGNRTIKNLNGRTTIIAPTNGNMPLLQTDLSLDIFDKSCFLKGVFKGNEGNFFLQTLEGDLVIDPINIKKNNDETVISVQGKMPLESLPLTKYVDLTGLCELSAWANLTGKPEAHGHLLITDLKTPWANLNQLQLFFKRKKQKQKFNFKAYDQSIVKIEGQSFWNEQANFGKLKLSNPNDLEFSSLKILKDSLQLDLEYTNSNISGNYNCNILFNGKRSHSAGKIIGNNRVLKLIGIFEDKNIVIEIELKPKFLIRKFQLKELSDGVYLKTEKNNSINLKFELSELRKFLPTKIGNLIGGTGQFEVSGKFENNQVKGKISSKKCNLIILKNSFNLIKKLETEFLFNLSSNELEIKGLEIELDKGSVSCSQAIFNFSNGFDFAYVPIVFNDCFLFWNDIFGTASGRLMLLKSDKESVVSGKIVLDETTIKNNIFSKDFSSGNFKSSMLDNWKASIILKSKKVINIQTPMLDASSRANLKISGSLSKPEIEGSIKIEDGNFHFPYKSLKITNGNLTFLPGDIDPIIELTAKSKIKNHLVSIIVSGTSSDAKLKLESIPDLTEEQIGSLLLVGSKNPSLNILIPALVMQNLKNIIFGTLQSQTKLQKYYKVLKPFKHIRFVPTFVEESGRGGFRGELEIDVSDKLHAVIQKNFNLTEDTRFEVDYQVTDDVSIRGIKDERGDLGGEIEMRWKF